MIVAPIIFCTVVHGIASVGEAKKVGRVAIKALIYFEIVTTFSLILGLLAVNYWQPGVGMNIDPTTLSGKELANVEQSVKPLGYGEFLVSLVPTSAVGAFAEGEPDRLSSLYTFESDTFHGGTGEIRNWLVVGGAIQSTLPFLRISKPLACITISKA